VPPPTLRSSNAPGPPLQRPPRRQSRGCSRHRTRRRWRLFITALVINRDGTIAGFQDKVQLDPSEEGTYSPGSGRRVFQDRSADISASRSAMRVGAIRKRSAGPPARRAHRFPPAFPRSRARRLPASSFADPANSFHEKAALCRAAENTCYFATVNYASAGSPTTSAVVRPDGTLLSYQPYGKRDCSSRTSTSLRPQACSRRAANLSSRTTTSRSGRQKRIRRIWGTSPLARRLRD
jgi:predicted amidohydrolase